MNTVDKFTKNKLFIFLVALGILSIILFILVMNIIDNSGLLEGITTELFGFGFDILLFGILITLYDNHRSKTNKIEQYLEEIEDYRGWREKEASYRIFGIIKRLQKEKYYDIDLTDCYFEDISFSKRDIINGFDFNTAILRSTFFSRCQFINVNFSKVKYSSEEQGWWYGFFNNAGGLTEFSSSTFQNCNFNNTFTSYEFKKCKFHNIDFENSNFENTKFINCEFSPQCKNIEKLTRSHTPCGSV